MVDILVRAEAETGLPSDLQPLVRTPGAGTDVLPALTSGATELVTRLELGPSTLMVGGFRARLLGEPLPPEFPGVLTLSLRERRLRALRLPDGEELWAAELPNYRNQRNL